jgi:hypothetical protein
MIIIKLPAFIWGYPLLMPELVWQITGSKLSEGSVLYRDLYETVEPFSAGLYYILSNVFGSSHHVYLVFALILTFLQAILFNFIISINNLFPERNYVPALLYVILSSMFIGFYTLSPVLLGTTFILFAIHFIFVLIRTGDRDEEIFYTGALIAIASLFYFPFFVFLLLAILVFLFFTPGNVRKYFVLLMGFIFPFLLTGTYYFVRDGLDEFAYCLSYSLFTHADILVSLKAMILVMLLPSIYLILSFAIISIYSRYINYQYVGIRVLGLCLVFSIISIYFSDSISPIQLFVLVPVLSFFIAHGLLLIKNKWIREVAFLVFAVVILTINYKYLFNLHHGIIPDSYQNMIVKKKPELPFELKGSKILVLGNDISYYQDNKIGGPYFDWKLSKKYFYDLNNYENVASIYNELSKDLPEVIIDKENLTPKLFDKIPELGNKYKKAGNYNVYLLKTGKY